MKKSTIVLLACILFVLPFILLIIEAVIAPIYKYTILYKLINSEN